MGCIDWFSIHGGWGLREETQEACAVSCSRWLNDLWDVHPDFRTLQWTGTGQQVATRNLRELCRSGDLPRLLLKQRIHTANRTRIVPDGYSFTATHGAGSSQWLQLRMHVGAGVELDDRWLPNEVELVIIVRSGPEALAPMLLGLKPVLFSMVDAWGIDFGWIASTSRMAQTADRASEPFYWRVRGAWAVYLAARLARRVIPPAQAIVERRASGGLFMSAARDVFDPTNLAEAAVADTIEASLAPLKPWPQD